MQKIFRSRESSIIGGVCGGLGEYFNIDPIIFRLTFIALLLAKGIGLVIYVIAWIVIPLRPKDEPTVPAGNSGRSEIYKYLPGLALVIVGAIFIIEHLWDWLSFGYLWPVVLIVLGIFLVYKAVTPKKEKQNER